MKRKLIKILVGIILFFNIFTLFGANITNKTASYLKSNKITYCFKQEEKSTFCISMSNIYNNPNIEKLEFNKNDLLKRNIEFNEIIIHHSSTENTTIESIHNYHKNKNWGGIGYHYYIRKDGTILKGRPLDYVGTHCKGRNSKSIGICLEGNFELTEPTDIQMASLIALSINLSQECNISKISKHQTYCNTDCPGKYFPWDAFESIYYDILEGKISY